MSYINGKPQCDMLRACTRAPTHIGEKGYIYCAEHAAGRRNVERCRRMAGFERAAIAKGEPVMSYRPITKARDAELRAARAAAGAS